MAAESISEQDARIDAAIKVCPFCVADSDGLCDTHYGEFDALLSRMEEEAVAELRGDAPAGVVVIPLVKDGGERWW